MSAFDEPELSGEVADLVKDDRVTRPVRSVDLKQAPLLHAETLIDPASRLAHSLRRRSRTSQRAPCASTPPNRSRGPSGR